MGMFDYMKVEYGIEQPEGIEWQTKFRDDPYLENIKIDAEGNLWHEYKEYEVFLDPEKEGLDQLCGSIRTSFCEWRKMDYYRGEVEFHSTDKHTGKWWSYSALFDNGKLLNIKRIEPEAV